MWGPASIWGRLLSQHVNFVLPVFIQKSSTNVYQYQYFVYFHDVLKVDAEDKIKHFNSWFVVNKLSLSLDKTTGNLLRLVSGTRRQSEALLLSEDLRYS